MRLTNFPGSAVVTEDGRELGHVIDLRAQKPRRMRRGDTEDIASIVYGHHGWLERIGVRAAEQRTISWSQVVRVNADRIVVRIDERKSKRNRRSNKE